VEWEEAHGLELEMEIDGMQWDMQGIDWELWMNVFFNGLWKFKFLTVFKIQIFNGF